MNGSVNGEIMIDLVLVASGNNVRKQETGLISNGC
jgi:hypothetical protein